MPQLSPMLWLVLYFYFSVCFLIMFTKIYYNK